MSRPPYSRTEEKVFANSVLEATCSVERTSPMPNITWHIRNYTVSYIFILNIHPKFTYKKVACEFQDRNTVNITSAYG